MPIFNFRIIMNKGNATVGVGEHMAASADEAKQQIDLEFLEHCDNCGQSRPPEGSYTVHIDE